MGDGGRAERHALPLILSTHGNRSKFALSVVKITEGVCIWVFAGTTIIGKPKLVKNNETKMVRDSVNRPMFVLCCLAMPRKVHIHEWLLASPYLPWAQNCIGRLRAMFVDFFIMPVL